MLAFSDAADTTGQGSEIGRHKNEKDGRRSAISVIVEHETCAVLARGALGRIATVHLRLPAHLAFL